MIKRNFLKGCLLLYGMLLLCTFCFSQAKAIIGLNLTGERTSSSDFVTGLGTTAEKRIAKHHGFETGIYYRTFKVHLYVYVNGLIYGDHHPIREKYLSLPVLYKFYSSLINFSAGPTFDLYLGSGQFVKVPFPGRLIPYTVDDKFHVGLLGKVSKSIILKKRILLEPEIRYNAIFYQKRSFYGAGLSLKYVLSD